MDILAQETGLVEIRRSEPLGDSKSVGDSTLLGDSESLEDSTIVGVNVLLYGWRAEDFRVGKDRGTNL